MLVGHCSDLGGGLPYLPFTEALAVLARDGGRRDGAVPERRPATGDDLDQLQFFDGVAATLARAGADRPVVLVLEDLHWADQSTRDLLMFLLRRLRDERLLIVATYRSDDLHRGHPLRPFLAEVLRLPVVERLEVLPFTAEEMTDYLHGLLGGPVTDETSRRILERSEGNAFFAAELAESGAGSHAGRLPTVLADLVLARLDGLPGDVLPVVRAAAVEGRRVRHDLLRAATGTADEDLESALRRAVAAHVLVPDGDHGYRFRHALLQEAVYGDLLPGERLRLHAAYARALSDAAVAGRPLGSAADLAHHRRQAQDRPAALVESLLAADEAERLHAPAEVWQQLEHALALWDLVPDAARQAGTTDVDLALRASHKASRAGRLHRARALAEDAVARVERLDPPADAAVAATAHQVLSDHLSAADHPQEALLAARAALDLVRDRPRSSEFARASAAAARALGALDRDDEAREHAEAARSVAADLALDAVEADALITLGRIEMAAGRGGRVDVTFRAAADRARSAGDRTTVLRAMQNWAADRYERGDVDGAVTLLEPTLTWAAETGLSWSPWGLELRALEVSAHYTAGRWDRALAAAGPSGTRPPDEMAARLAVLALLVRLARGEDVAAAVAALDRAWDYDPLTALNTGVVTAEHHRWAGRAEAAVAAVDRAFGLLADRARPWYLFGIRVAALGLGAVGDLAERPAGPAALDGEPLDAVADRLLARVHEAVENGHPRVGVLGPEGVAWLARAHAEHDRVCGRDPDRSVRLWREAADAFAHDPYESARSLRHLAVALVVAGDRAGAAQALDRARDAAGSLGASPLLGALDVVARRARLGGRAPATGPLTAREHEVLELVAEGLTNRLVGERLFMAEKTVSVHVSRIIAKMGAAGRTDAVAKAHRRGLLADRSRR